jgi:hypothetical protein
MFTSLEKPTPPKTVRAPEVEFVEEVVETMFSGPPNVDWPDRPMPPLIIRAPVVVLVDVAVNPLRTTAPFLTMKSLCAIQFPFPREGGFNRNIYPYVKKGS